MLRKNYRDIYYVGVDLKYRPTKGGFEVTERPNPLRCMVNMINYLKVNNIILYRYDNKRKSIGLRSIEYDKQRKIFTFLFIAGDKDIVDPTFWDDDNNTIRTEKALENEKVSYSCHATLSMEKLKSGRFCSAKEDVRLITDTNICKLINSFFKNHLSTKITIDDKKIKVYPYIDIEKLATKTLECILSGKKLCEIEARYVLRKNNGYDENFSIKQDLKRISLVPTSFWDTNKTVRKIMHTVKSLNQYNEVYIRYKDNDIEGSVDFEVSEVNEDFINKLFAQKERIRLNKNIEQACTTIHSELSSKMKRKTIVEVNFLRNFVGQDKEYAQECQTTPPD